MSQERERRFGGWVVLRVAATCPDGRLLGGGTGIEPPANDDQDHCRHN
jgi:hypothetical protein